MKPLVRVVAQMRAEAEVAPEGPRALELGFVADFVEGKLARAGAVEPSDVQLVADLRDWASLATERARSDRGNPTWEAMRRLRWRAVFRVAEALGVDAFGRTPEQVAAREGPELERSWRRCGGRRKDGKACRGRAQSGTRFCYQDQPEAVTADEPLGEDLAGLEVNAERSFFEEAERILGGVAGKEA